MMTLLVALMLAAAPAQAKKAAPKKSAAAAPAKDPARALAQRLHDFYAHTKDFSATFTQHRVSAAMGRAEELSGTVRVKKPGLVRWDYDKPEVRSIYIEGKTLWMYFPEDKQAQVTHGFGGDQLSSAFTFLWGQGNLLAEFDPRLARRPDGLPDGDALELLPKKPMAGIEKMLFVVGKDGQVVASVVTNPQGDTNQLIFSAARTDQGLKDDVFHFVPPKGTFVQNL